MNSHDLERLLQLKKQDSPPEDGYQSTEQFLATFRQRQQRPGRRRQWAALLPLAASLVLLIGIFAYHFRNSSVSETALASLPDCSLPWERLAELEHVFGLDSNAMFINDELVFFERPSPARAKYRVLVQLLQTNTNTLTTLEFFAASDDYIILNNEQVSGNIFLHRCDNRESVFELNLALQGDAQKIVRMAKVFAAVPGTASQTVDQNFLVRVDICTPPQT